MIKVVTLMNKFKITKRKAVAAGIVTAAMLILSGLAISGEGMNTRYFILALLLSLAAGGFCLSGMKFNKWVSAVLVVVLPAAALCSLEYYTHVPQDLTPMIFLLNLLFFWILYGMLTVLTGRSDVGCCIATLVPMLFGLANYFVVQFRSSPIVPWDLLSIGTAVTVTDSYSFTFKWSTVFVLYGFIWVLLLASRTTLRIRRPVIRIPAAAAFVALMAVYVNGIQSSAVQAYFGMDTTLFTLNVLYRNNGIAAAFLGNLRFLNLEEPEGYATEKVEELQAKVEELAAKGQETGNSSAAESQDDMPNVIVIMDEAFSDLSVWGDFNTSQEVMPFFQSIQEESVGGEVYVSVKGGNTANTEFEFLTGDTMGFLPAGSIPYQQYINEELPNLASHLKGLGYQTVAIHPYYKTGWDRDEVYDLFGFDDFLGMESFASPLKYRGYISDQSAFEKIIEQYEQKSSDARMFVFEVTMQNHGGYSKETPDFDSYVKLPDVTFRSAQTLAVEKYLTLMNRTDRALEELVTYFEEQEEPVILLMFGDHQPSDYITNPVARLTGFDSDGSLEAVQTGYRVPFVIWSNYGLEQKYYEGISVNYLSSILMQEAGIPLTDYQQYLSELMEMLPVITGNVYQDAEGTFYNWSEKAYEEELNEYRMIQYNHLVDGKNRVESFFE